MRMLLLTALMIFVSSASSAGLYKWVDDEGNVHYSQNPPIDKQFERLKKPKPAEKSTTSLYPSSTTDADAAAEATIKSETAKSAKRKKENCEVGKNNLNVYQVYRRFRGKDGIVSRISEEERAKKIAKAKQLIRDFCN